MFIYSGVYKDSEGGGGTGGIFRIFFTPLEKYTPPIMMYIKLLVLVGVDLNFQALTKHQMKASFRTFQLSPCFIPIIIDIYFTLTTFV